jgi:ABC-2 type transport system permease protein
VALSTVWTFYARALREVRRVPLATVVVPLAVSVFMLTIFARVFSGIVELEAFEGVQYSFYVTPAAIVMAVMLGSATAGVSTAVERQTGFYDRMRITPVRELASLRARRLADATRLAGFAVVLLVVARIDGVEIRDWPLAIAVACGLGAAWGVAYGGLALAACLRTASAETAQGMAPLFFPILFMSTAVMPAELLPSWLASIADYNPVSYICDAMRAANAGHLDEAALAKAAAGIVALGAVTQFLVVRARAAIAVD